jgi:hypothetical protein
MTNLFISKATEAKAIATVWNMATESLSQDTYTNLDNILRQLSKTRNIDEEVLAVEQMILSGKRVHASDCETSGSPAYICGPCNCEA